MKRLAWATDVHFNFVTDRAVLAFGRYIAALAPDALLLGGDIGEANSVEAYLALLEGVLPCPVYVVLGNHDYYGGSIRAVEQRVATHCNQSPRLCWLPTAGIVPLSDHTALVGHGGWADARCGNYARSKVDLNDYHRIADLLGHSHAERRRALERLGDEAATHFAQLLPEALASFDQVVVLTHVPPFRESCWHEGHLSDDNHLPHFACKAVGDLLQEAMRTHPNRTMTVLCGHTHSGGIAHVLPNLTVLTGHVTYGMPALQTILQFE